MKMLKNVDNHFNVGLSLIKELLSQLVDIELGKISFDTHLVAVN